MPGNRPPDPPLYSFDAERAWAVAAEHGMRLRHKPGAPGYGWVWCPKCGWGEPSDATRVAHWLIDLSFYAVLPWGCAYCRAEDRAASRAGGDPTTSAQSGGKPPASSQRRRVTTAREGRVNEALSGSSRRATQR